ncbi:F0F1 ATP synthase subunit delta [Mesobacillus maritimus]|uniref:F0F1 ATP synthase subunit delta n=1 Tax=Mesobacillus maritimus TaxID=1643336 RepID=UPI00203A98BC|nr:F0F1 ATP synthase subunit delta [Mesobacillus maritimus]MCM3586878.1 F0F1 ATP synthase subunit delta [Mesobacillus maritimus]MCM3668767.1 F0F1 ATP synthase subunit delta [Mesobacillus maritimus]
MSNPQVAKRYALALFQVASEQNLLDTVEGELRVVKEVFQNNTGLTPVLASPNITLEKKKELLNQAFASASPYVLNTLMLLVDRHRTALITEVADQFIELVNEAKGLAEAKVYSVQPLTDEQKEALSLAFAPKVGKKALILENITDSNLLGGIKLRVGNRIFDGSLRGKLDRLERKLLG